MLLDVVDAMLHDGGVLLGIASVAWLQIQIVCFQMAIVNGTLAVEHELEFVGMRNDDWGWHAGKGSLWRAGYPVDALREQVGAVGLDSNKVTCLMPGFYEGFVSLEGRFSSCQYDKLAFSSCLSAPLHDVVCRHLRVVHEIGVAERARQVASAHSDEDGRSSCPPSLALEGVEYLVDSVGSHSPYINVDVLIEWLHSVVSSVPPVT